MATTTARVGPHLCGRLFLIIPICRASNDYQLSKLG
jgi:hypothetical protein